MSKIVSDPRLPTVNDEKIRPLTQRLYELFRQYAIAHNKSYMWDTEGTAAPTTGTWSISQMCKNTAPSGTGSLVIGWICVASGTPGTWVSMTGGVGRERLTSNRTYYVRTDGSDSNDGLTNTSGGAFITIQKALDVISSTLDIAYGVVCTVQIADGTYTGANTVNETVGTGSVVIKGNSGTPANVIISTTSGHCFNVPRGAVVTIKDLKMQTTTSGWAIVCIGGSKVTYSNLNFGACATGHIYVSQSGAVNSSTSYVISGSAPFHVQSTVLGSFLSTAGTVTLTGTPTFSYAFVMASNVSAIYCGGTVYSGAATGKRYDVTLNSTISSNGGGATFFPGDVAGTTATGGQYV